MRGWRFFFGIQSVKKGSHVCFPATACLDESMEKGEIIGPE